MNTNLLARLPNFADLLLDAVFVVDVHGRILYVSAACERIFGYAPDELAGMEMIDLVVPEDRARTQEEAARVMAGQSRIGFENRYIRKDGRHVHIMWSARWSESEQLRIGVARDVTERKLAEERQAAIYAISEAAQGTTELVALFREIHRIVSTLVPASAFAVGMRDVRTGLLEFPYQMSRDGNVAISQEGTVRRLCVEVLQTGQPLLYGEASASDADSVLSSNTQSWLAVPLVSQSEAIGALVLRSHPGMVYSATDKELLQFVSAQIATAIERRQLNERLLHAALYDELTGLPNRRLFHDRMESALARCRRAKRRTAILYIDIDHFKAVNDVFGHAAGDRLLKEVAHGLKSCVREEDTVGRLGGDEFVILLEQVKVPDDVCRVVDKVRALVSDPIGAEYGSLQVATSIGIALYPDHGESTEMLLKHADKAMYSEKKARAAMRGG